MNKMNWMVAVLAVATLALAGCSKGEKPAVSEQIGGVSVDMPKLQQSFSSTTNEQARKLIVEASMGLRYSDYPKSLMALDQLSNLPDLTPEQKKVVADVIEQEKKLAGNAAPAAAPGQ